MTAAGLTVERLQIWYRNLRTRFTRKKSYYGADEPTGRDQGVLGNFAFLAPFTYEVKKRPLVTKYYLKFTTCKFKFYI